MPSGYSGTPLANKLSLKNGMRVWRDGMPQSIADEIAEAGLGLQLLPLAEAPLDVTTRTDLEAKLNALRPILNPDGTIWVSWPKKASKCPTDVTEDVIRLIALPMQLVDVKVCSVDDTWSGLKLVIRKEHR